MDNLEGLKVAILVTDGFEQVELLQPRQALDEAGADTQVVSPKDERVRGWNFTDWGDEVAVDLPLSRARPQDFDALLLPGGVINPDTLRMLPDAVAFVQAFFDEGKPVASICHGPWMVIEGGDGDRGGRGARPARDIVAVAQDRPQECRRGVGRSGGRNGPGPGHQPQTR
jgi:protease I